MRGAWLFWIIVLASSCIADFSAVSMYSEIRICQGGSFTDTITVSNLEENARTYAILPGEYAKASPSEFTLEPFFQQEVSNAITPDMGVGTYGLETVIVDDRGRQKTLRQDIRIEDCKTTVGIEENSFSNCPCTPTLYLFQVSNNGEQSRAYSIGVNISAEYYTVSASEITVEPGQQFPVYVFVNLPCDMFGRHEFEFSAASANVTTTAPFYLAVRDTCYTYNVNIQNETDFCRNGRYTVPVSIENTGELKNNYSVLVTSPLFFINETVSLMPGEEITYELSTNASAGSYPVDIEVVPSLGYIRESGFDFNIRECPGINLGAALVAVIVIILVLAIVLLFRGRSEKKDSSGPARRYLYWLVPAIIIIAAIILLVVFFSAAAGFISMLLASMWAFFLAYLMYFVIGLVAAVLIIIYFWRSKYRSSMFWFWAVVFVGFIFLLMTLCFFSGVCNVQVAGNETVSDSPLFAMKKNSVKRIDLGDYIRNPDRDELAISYTPVENLSLEIDGDYNLFVTPDEGWHGERIINFIADDNRGGRAVSPDVRIVVLDQEPTPFDPLLDFATLYSNYIFAGLLVSVIVVILLILYTSRPRSKRLIVRRKLNK